MSRRLLVPVILVICLLAGMAWGQTKRRPAVRKPAPAAKVPQRTKVAEGLYRLRATEGGALHAWDEPWTLYKTRTGFEVEEQWRATKEGYSNAVIIDVFLALAPGLYPTQVRIGADQSPTQLNCSMLMNEFRCAAGGKDSVLPMLGHYNFFLPSPWLLTSIARRAPKSPDKPVKVKLVQMAGMTPAGPKLVQIEAEVVYVGDDLVEIQSDRIQADIYEIRTSESPAIIVWISPEGIVLMMQDAAKPDQRMELVEFKKAASF